MSEEAIRAFEHFVAGLGEAYLPGRILGSSGDALSDFSPLLHYAEPLRWLEGLQGASRVFRYCAGEIHSNVSTGYCGLHHGHFCFGLTTGMYNSTLEMSTRTFQSDVTFREIGRLSAPPGPRGEAEELELWGSGWLKCLLRLAARKKKSAADGRPPVVDVWSDPEFAARMMIPCPVRRACAEYVAWMMSAFMWGHEFAHAISGHLPYLERSMKVTRISEDEWFEPSPQQQNLYANLRLWMEHDADTSAIRNLMVANLTGVRLRRVGVPQIDEDRGLRLRLDVQAIVLTFLTLLFQYDWVGSEADRHPDPLRRLFVAMSVIFECFRAYHLAPERLTALVMEDLRALTMANATINHPLAFLFTSISRDIFTTEYNDLVEAVSAEIPKIRSYSYFNESGVMRAPA